jgi:hypothetical protein
MNFINQSLKHTSLWAVAPQCSVLTAFEGNYSTAPTSIRGSNDQSRMQQGFIEGDGYA